MPVFSTARAIAIAVLLSMPAIGARAADPSADASATPKITVADTVPASVTAAEIELQRKLDQPFDLTLKNVELSEAFKQIAATAQISLQVDPACYDALPYGATTHVTADFRQAKLRAAIEQVLIPLSLQQTVSGSTVVIRPSGPLARIGRRAQWDELQLLQELRTSPDLKVPTSGDFDWTTALRGAIDDRPNLVIAFAGETAGVARALHDKAMDQIKKQLPMSAFRALDLYCELTHQIWFVEAATTRGGGTIYVMPVRQWIDRQLQRPVQLSFTNAHLDQVVAELAHVSGIRFTPEPGLYQAVPIVSLTATNCSVLQALETLSGVTRIAFDVRDDSILLHMAGNPLPVSGNTAPKVEPYVAHINVPVGDGLIMDVAVHESDLPPELDALRKKKIQEAVEGLQRAWSSPSTQPTSPAAAVRTSMPTTPGVTHTTPPTTQAKK